jgi:glycosyltransferase involved in cell wall biosynthesis
MRVLLSIHHDLDPDAGAPGATLDLGSAYRELGHEVSYMSFADLPKRLPAVAKEALYPLAAAPHLARARVDVIDASTGDAWLVPRGRLWRAGAPLLVARSHGLEHRFWEAQVEEAQRAGRRLPARTRAYHGGVRLRAVAATLRAADLALFLNRDDLDYAVSRLGVQRERARVIRNGVSDELFDVPVDEPAEGVRVAHVGSWAERKGVAYLAEALSRLLEGDSAVAATLLGTGVAADDVLRAFPDAVRERVRVVPSYRRRDLPGLLRGHHALATASLAEGFSVALVEGMAAGLAPVATGISGNREIVRDGHNGLLVPVRSGAALAEGLERLASSPELLARLRRAARDSVQELRWRRVAAATAALYEESLERRGWSAGRTASATS